MVSTKIVTDSNVNNSLQKQWSLFGEDDDIFCFLFVLLLASLWTCKVANWSEHSNSIVRCPEDYSLLNGLQSVQNGDVAGWCCLSPAIYKYQQWECYKAYYYG